MKPSKEYNGISCMSAYFKAFFRITEALISDIQHGGLKRCDKKFTLERWRLHTGRMLKTVKKTSSQLLFSSWVVGYIKVKFDF